MRKPIFLVRKLKVKSNVAVAVESGRGRSGASGAQRPAPLGITQGLLLQFPLWPQGGTAPLQ